MFVFLTATFLYIALIILFKVNSDDEYDHLETIFASLLSCIERTMPVLFIMIGHMKTFQYEKGLQRKIDLNHTTSMNNRVSAGTNEDVSDDATLVQLNVPSS